MYTTEPYVGFAGVLVFVRPVEYFAKVCKVFERAATEDFALESYTVFRLGIIGINRIEVVVVGNRFIIGIDAPFRYVAHHVV